MPSPLFPSSTESEVAEALLILSELEPFVWGTKKKRSIRHKSESDSKITAKDETETKIVPKILSPSSPLCFNSIADDPQPPSDVPPSDGPPSEVSPSEASPSEVPPSEMPPRSTPPKRRGEILKERKERVAVLAQDNLTLQKTCLEMKTRYLMLKEHNAWLKWMKEGLALNRQYWGRIPIESMGNVAAMEEMRRKMLLLAEKKRRLWRDGCAAARKRRKRLMRRKLVKKEDRDEESERREEREECAAARAARKRRMELMRTNVGKKRQRLG